MFVCSACVCVYVCIVCDTYSGGGGTPGENTEAGEPVVTGIANVAASNTGAGASEVVNADKRDSKLVTT